MQKKQKGERTYLETALARLANRTTECWHNHNVIISIQETRKVIFSGSCSRSSHPLRQLMAKTSISRGPLTPCPTSAYKVTGNNTSTLHCCVLHDMRHTDWKLQRSLFLWSLWPFVHCNLIKRTLNVRCRHISTTPEVNTKNHAHQELLLSSAVRHVRRVQGIS